MRKPRLPGHSTVAAYLALFVALSLGTAWAATELDKNEVKSKHIGKGQVKNADLANDAVTSPKVANGSLLGEDFAANQLPPGPQGEQGIQGETGLQGAPGIPATKLFALLDASGTGAGLLRGKGVTSATRSDIGRYIITFDQDLAGCVPITGQAAQGAFFDAIVFNSTAAIANDNRVLVSIRNSTGAFVDGEASLAVFC